MRYCMFNMLYKVVLTLSLGKALVCDHSNECYWAVLSYVTVNNNIIMPCYRVVETF